MTIKQQGGVFGRNPSFNDVKVDGDLSFADNSKALFGASSDLQIYHDGSNSYIKDAGTGFLNIGGYGSVKISNPDGTNVGAVFTSAGSVDLNFNGQNRLSTLVSGVSVTGNVIVASGNGIDFSATAGTGTSELFDDYEEGTWTPNAFTNYATTSITPGGSATYAGTYTKIGNMVYCKMDVNLNNGATSVAVGDLWGLSGLPFTSDTSLITGAGVGIVYGSVGSNVLGQLAIQTGGNNLYIRAIQVSGASNYGHIIRGQFSYPVA